MSCDTKNGYIFIKVLHFSRMSFSPGNCSQNAGNSVFELFKFKNFLDGRGGGVKVWFKLCCSEIYQNIFNAMKINIKRLPGILSSNYWVSQKKPERA